jgi:NAD+ synthase (glutamine-hydrolysing)
MLTMIQQAQAQQVELIVFPEMAIPGYLLGDTWEQPSFLRDCEEYGNQIIAASRNICVVFGNVAVDWNKAGDDGRVRKYNACFVAQNGSLCTSNKFPYPFRIKTLHPNYREFDDTRHFYSLRKLAIELGEKTENLLQPVEVTLDGRTVNLACILCEDGWCDDYCVKPISTLHENHDLSLIINISNSPFTLGKNNKRNRVFSKQAAETKTPLIYVNTTGLQNNGKTVYTFDGYSTVYNASGQVVAYCPPFVPALQVVELDLATKGDNLPAVETPDDNGIDSICTALTYGVTEFLHHVGLEKVVIGVSGGIDSAVAAALYASVLGPDKLLLANLPSVYNSTTTKNLAKQLAKNLGARYTVVPIQPAVELTVSQLQAASVEGSDGTRATLTVSPFMIENIQARDRSARVLAGLAAAFGGGFTCNANKSELTVGYSTLYGDQAGFLAALGDLWKHQVYALGNYLNTKVYNKDVIPQDVFDIVPSAELSAAQSVDEGKGDPLVYPYHDYLFRAFMEWWNRATPEDILLWYSNNELEERLGCERGLIKHIFKSSSDFIADLERWWKLYSGMGVAKRIQAPPILAVSRRAYGFDHREAQNQPYYTANYYKLKAQLLTANN